MNRTGPLSLSSTENFVKQGQIFCPHRNDKALNNQGFVVSGLSGYYNQVNAPGTSGLRHWQRRNG